MAVDHECTESLLRHQVFGLGFTRVRGARTLSHSTFSLHPECDGSQRPVDGCIFYIYIYS